jgi:HD domain
VAALVRHPLIDEILDARREYAHGDTAGFEGYRNHAHRVYCFARSIASVSPEDEDKVAIAAAFHDLCTFDGLDYLEPSIEKAARYLLETGRKEWDREVALMIAFHHRVRPYRGEHARLAEPFRRADWNDFTMGVVRGGIPRDVRRAADAELPVTDFIPKAIVRLVLGWLPRHPLRPAPVFRGGAAPAAHRAAADVSAEGVAWGRSCAAPFP